ncbi:MAG: 5-deoxy-glucuronate isomerase, partial [Aestuariivirga sp.]
MPTLLVKAKKKTGLVIDITPKSAKWKYVGHEVWKLATGKIAKGFDAKRETCIVFMTGKGRVSVDGKDIGVLGERASVFEGKPWSIYLPP